MTAPLARSFHSLENRTMTKDTAADKAAEATQATQAEKADGAPHVYHADRGEGIPTPPLKTATDEQ